MNFLNNLLIWFLFLIGFIFFMYKLEDNRNIEDLKKNEILFYKCSKHGVEYLQTKNKMFVSYMPDGKLATCKP